MTTSGISTIEKVFVKTGRITSVRAWDGGKLHELHLHLPDVHFDEWNRTQSIKCRISSLHYSDYSPAMWDEDEKTCTLYIDTSHAGKGSVWTRAQRRGDYFYYLKIEPESHFPVSEKRLVFLGDQTAIGHFCALQQLAGDAPSIKGYLVVNDLRTANSLRENCPWLPLQPVVGYQSLLDYTTALVTEHPSEQSSDVFYVVGNAQLVVAIRRLLKANGIEGRFIKSKGFWQ